MSCSACVFVQTRRSLLRKQSVNDCCHARKHYLLSSLAGFISNLWILAEPRVVDAGHQLYIIYIYIFVHQLVEDGYILKCRAILFIAIIVKNVLICKWKRGKDFNAKCCWVVGPGYFFITRWENKVFPHLYALFLWPIMCVCVFLDVCMWVCKVKSVCTYIYKMCEMEN